MSAALSDFEQLSQVHAENLPQPCSEGSGSSRTPEKGISEREPATRPPRATLQRQDDIVQGTETLYGQSGGAVGEQHCRQSGGFLILEEALKVVRMCAPLRSAVFLGSLAVSPISAS